MALWLLRVLTLGDVQRTRCITVHRRLLPLPPCALKIEQLRATHTHNDVLHPESKQQTTPAAPRDALECVAALARTREFRQNCVRLPGPDRGRIAPDSFIIYQFPALRVRPESRIVHEWSRTKPRRSICVTHRVLKSIFISVYYCLQRCDATPLLGEGSTTCGAPPQSSPGT